MTKYRTLPLAVWPLLFACGCATHQQPTNAAAPATVPSVPAVRVTRANLSAAITLTGEFIPFQDVDVMAKVSGYISSIKVDIGDRVRQGQVLAILEVPEMQNDLTRALAAIDQANAQAASAEDQVHRAESAHEIAHLSLTRLQNVANKEPGLVPQQEVDQVRSRDLEAEAQVAAAKSDVGAARERIKVMRADQARLKTMQNYETITAPFDGVVTKRYANTGSMIQAGTASQTQAMPVVRIAQNNLLRLVLPVPESSVSNVSIGREVKVRVPSLNRTFTGRVSRFTHNVQLSTRTMDTEIDVSNPSLTLMPGMYAEVDLALQEHQNTLTAPPDAIDGTAANARVFVIGPGDVIHIAAVQLGLETAQRVEIVKGINEGDLIIVGRRGSLKEGDHVKPVPADFVTSK
jgi:RND family efflux transporter MFP subunit